MADTIKHMPNNKFYEAEVIISDLSDKNNEHIIEQGSFYSRELITLDSIVNKTNSHDALVAALKAYAELIADCQDTLDEILTPSGQTALADAKSLAIKALKLAGAE